MNGGVISDSEQYLAAKIIKNRSRDYFEAIVLESCAFNVEVHHGLPSEAP
jgi:hypothetical protein